MGRKDTDEMSAAQILYPCMQCADIFFLKVSRPTDIFTYLVTRTIPTSRATSRALSHLDTYMAGGVCVTYLL
jgi:hypothetical protein